MSDVVNLDKNFITGGVAGVGQAVLKYKTDAYKNRLVNKDWHQIEAQFLLRLFIMFLFRKVYRIKSLLKRLFNKIHFDYHRS